LCQTVSAQTELQLDQPFEREIKKDETQIFKVNAKSGEFVRVVVWQKNADVGLKLFSANGEKLVEVDNSDNPEEPERISFVAADAGEFRVAVSGLKTWKTPGNYEIKLDALRASSAADKSRIEAEKLYDQAISDWFSGKTDAKTLAVKSFSDALPLFQSAADRFGEAFVHYYLGILYIGLNDSQKSLENSSRSAQIFREIKAFPQLARVLSNEAAIHYKFDNLKKAEELCLEAIEIYRRLGDKKGVAEIGGNLALIASESGNPRAALKVFEEILPIFQAENDRVKEAWVLHNIGSVYDDLGEPGKAIEFLEKALQIRREIKEKGQQAVTLVNLGAVFKSVGDAQKAIENLKEALEIFRTLGNEINQTYCLNNLGAIYDDLGDYSQALEFYEKSLELNRKLKLRANEAGNLNNLALLNLKTGNSEKALELQTKALEIFRQLKDRTREAMALVNLGVILQYKGEKQKALEFLQAALPIFREAGLPDWEANTLFRAGEIFYLSGDFQKSFENCSNALEINRKIQNRLGETVALLCSAKAESRLGRLAESQTKAEQALALIEDSRRQISRQDLQAKFFATKQDYYEFYIDLLMRRHRAEPAKGFDALAFEASERARARNLLESIGQTELREGIPGELLEKEKSLRRTINAKETLRQKFIRAKEVEKKAEIEKEIAGSIGELQETVGKIRAANPKFAQFSDAKPLGLPQIQSAVLDENSVLLEYALGAERSFLFVAAKNSLKVLELPKRAEIEALARAFYDSLKMPRKALPDETEKQTEIRLQKADAELRRTSAELGKMLLLPAAGAIENKRLLIVSSEVLQYIPFAALKNPNSAAQFLIETNEIVNLPSASALATLRKNERQSPTKELAVFADPVFDKNDVRLRPAVRQNADSTARSNYSRLVFSGQEAEKIALFVPPEKRFAATGLEANLANLRKQDLSQYRILHFATHSLLDPRFNELSGVVLSLVDEKGNSQDGVWRLNEIYNLRLNARLVVLSACETALGAEIRGEGLVGFTHAFMYAGAKSVAASLWLVDDRPTFKLMERFYQAMLKENLPPSKALQKAQISMIKEKGLDAPFYWAAFTLQGEWR
jgi:CHAT domain-containing protein/tetratricopeptide (TPR) repeat protein